MVDNHQDKLGRAEKFVSCGVVRNWANKQHIFAGVGENWGRARTKNRIRVLFDLSSSAV